MKQLFISILLCATFSIQLYSQPQRQQPGAGHGGNDASLTGRIIDATTNQAIEYANIVLYREKDAKMVNGTITDASGSFKLDQLPYGKFYLTVNFIGYNRDTIKGIKLFPKQKHVNLGKISIKQSAVDIEGVDVVADRAHVEYKIDKKVVNVSQDITSVGGTAVEALENVPSVTVDIEGNVSLRGSTNFTVLIDGKPSVLDGTDALKQIPVSSIENIEIITNPSAKYDPDGVAGIINVVLKKEKRGGFSGVINGMLGSNNKYGGDFTFSYRNNKVNVFAGAGYRNFSFESNGNSERETYLNDTTDYQFYDIQRDFVRAGYNIKAGMDFYATEKATITLSGRYGMMDFGRNLLSKVHTYDSPFTFENYSINQHDFAVIANYYSLTFNYQQKFERPFHKLDVMLHYSSRDGENTEEQNEQPTTANWQPTDENPYRNKSNETGPSQEFRLEVDYTQPIGEKGKLEAGLQTRIDDEPEDYVFENYNFLSETWETDDMFSREMEFSRNIYAAYTTISNEFNRFAIMAGLRAEYTDRRINHTKTDEPYTINRLDFYPTLHLSRQFENGNQVQASYSRRIRRPRGWYLEPFPSYIDSRNMRVGNPELKPEYISSVEINYQKRFNTSYVAFETYYRLKTNDITRIRTVQDDGIMLHTYENLDEDHSLGAELSGNLELTKWLRLNPSATVYLYKINGTVDEETVNTESINWNCRLNSTFKVTPTTRIQTNMYYRGPSVTAQGEREGFFMTGAAVRQDFFGRKLSLALRVRDIFGTAKHEFISEGTDFYTYNYFTRESPMFYLSVTYLINNYKKGMKGDRENGDSMDFEGGEF